MRSRQHGRVSERCTGNQDHSHVELLGKTLDDAILGFSLGIRYGIL